MEPIQNNRFNLSRWAIEHSNLTVYFLLVLLFAGGMSYFSLGQDEDPPFSFRVAAVRAFWPGATAQQMAEQVADKIEETIQEVPYADQLRSYSKAGETTLILELLDSTPAKDIPETWHQLRKKINAMAIHLPQGVQGPFVDDEFGDVFGIIYGLSADGYDWAELEKYADRVRQELLRIPDVAKVEFFGKQSRRLYIDISQHRLSQLGINMPMVIDEIQRQNRVSNTGVLRTSEENIQVRVSGQFSAAEELALMPLRFGERTFLMRDIAEVYQGYSDPSDPKTRFQQQDVVAIGVSMAKGGDIIRLGKALQAHEPYIQSLLPVGIELHQIQDQPEVVSRSVQEFLQVLLEALIIVLAVSFVALGLKRHPLRIDMRPGLVVALSIPTVLAITFLIMKQWGIDLHKVSLGSLIIALGLMVDDAIIIIEMTARKLEEGYDRFSASTYAYSATAMPMLTGTLITAAGFLPIGLAQSSVGEYAFAIFGVTTVAVLVSWLVSVYFVPYIGFHLLKERADRGEEPFDVFDGPMYNRIRRAVHWCVVHKKTTISLTVLAFILGLGGLQIVEKQFFPESNRPEVLVDLWMPEGTSFQAMEEVVWRAEQELMAINEVDTITSFIGAGVPRFYLSLDQIFPQPNVAQLILTPASAEIKVRDAMLNKAARLLDERFPEIRPRARLLPNGPPVAYPVQFRLVGPELKPVREYADKVRAYLEQDGDMRGVNDNWNEMVKTIQLEVDQARARALGVSSQSISQAAETLLNGVPVGEYLERNRTIPIVLRQPESERANLESIANTYMPTATGHSVPFSHVARTQFAWEPGVIWRHNRDYAVTIQGDVRPGIQGSTVALRLESELKELMKDLPPGYYLKTAGTLEQSSKGESSITAWIPLMLFIMFTLLMLQLRSFSRSVLVFITGPLGIVGAVTTLIILKQPLGFVAFLGVIALNGMIIRNSVILIDQIEQDISRGIEPWQAVVDSAVRRFRPITLTAITAVLAMVPLARSNFWGPMAVSIMGGLMVATVLTLLSLPAMYAAWFKVEAPRKLES